MFRFIVNMEIEGTEVSHLRESVGWDRRDGDFPSLFTKCLFWAGVRDENGKLVGFGYITGPGIEHGIWKTFWFIPNTNVRAMDKKSFNLYCTKQSDNPFP